METVLTPVDRFLEATGRPPRTGPGSCASTGASRRSLSLQPDSIVPREQHNVPWWIAELVATQDVITPVREPETHTAAPSSEVIQQAGADPPPSLSIRRSRLPRQGDHPQGDATEPVLGRVQSARQVRRGAEKGHEEINKGSGGAVRHLNPLVEAQKAITAVFSPR